MQYLTEDKHAMCIGWVLVHWLENEYLSNLPLTSYLLAKHKMQNLWPEP
jgi:hypothetical protein